MSEMITIVDEQDQILGHKPRNEIDFENDIYRVSALWLTNSAGQILIAQRKLTKDKDPGKWGPAVAGTVEQRESYEENIVKETQEELGVTGINFEVGPKMRIIKPRNYFIQWFLSRCDLSLDAFTPQESEVEKLLWVHEEELRNDVTANPDKFVPIFAAAMEELTQ